jgi:hypothetical protein
VSLILAWDGQSGIVQNEVRRNTLDVKPFVSNLEFDTIYFEPIYGNKFKTLNGASTTLTEQEIDTITEFIGTYVFKSLAVGSNGLFLGQRDENDPEVAYTVAVAPPNNDNWYWNASQSTWQYVYGIDVDGNFLGNVPVTDCAFVAPTAPPFTYSKFIGGEWVDGRSTAQLIKELSDDIDKIAGDVRATYITVAPGQEAVYIMKAQQARLFLAGGLTNIENYPFIKAEAEALDKSYVDLATEIVYVENAWITVASTIEASRLYIKQTLRNSTDLPNDEIIRRCVVLANDLKSLVNPNVV